QRHEADCARFWSGKEPAAPFGPPATGSRQSPASPARCRKLSSPGASNGSGRDTFAPTWAPRRPRICNPTYENCNHRAAGSPETGRPITPLHPTLHGSSHKPSDGYEMVLSKLSELVY